MLLVEFGGRDAAAVPVGSRCNSSDMLKGQQCCPFPGQTSAFTMAGNTSTGRESVPTAGVPVIAIATARSRNGGGKESGVFALMRARIRESLDVPTRRRSHRDRRLVHDMTDFKGAGRDESLAPGRSGYSGPSTRAALGLEM